MNRWMEWSTVKTAKIDNLLTRLRVVQRVHHGLHVSAREDGAKLR